MDFKTNVDCTTCKYCFESVDVHGITKRYCTLHNAQIVYCDVACNEYDKGKCKDKNYFTAHNKVLLKVDKYTESNKDDESTPIEEKLEVTNANTDESTESEPNAKS